MCLGTFTPSSAVVGKQRRIEDSIISSADVIVNSTKAVVESALQVVPVEIVDEADGNDNVTCIGDDTVAKPLRILYSFPVSPLTYFSGIASVYQPYFKYLLKNNPDDELILVTAEANIKLQPAVWPQQQQQQTSQLADSIGTHNDTRTMDVHHTFGIPLWLYPTFTVATDITLKLGRIIYNTRPDMIHSCVPGPYDIPNIIYSRLFGIPLLLVYHTNIMVVPALWFGEEEWSKSKSIFKYIVLAFISFLEYAAWKYMQIMYYFSDLFVHVGPEMQEEFEQHGMDNAVVWRKGIDTDSYTPEHYNEQMRCRMTNNRTDKPFVLVQCGRFAIEKRIHLLKDMMDLLPSNVHLCLVGAGPEEPRLRQLFLEGENNLTANRVTFAGYMSGVELCQAFASADVFVMTSDSETMGCVVLESLASGVPCIGVNNLGVSGLIDDGVTGYLCDNANIVNEMVDKITILMNDDQFRNQMGINGRNEMLKWSIDASAKNLRGLCTQCVQNFNDYSINAKWHNARRKLCEDIKTVSNILLSTNSSDESLSQSESKVQVSLLHS